MTSYVRICCSHSIIRARQDSGALSWGDVENFGEKVINGIQQAAPVVSQAVDVYNKIKGKGEEKRDVLAELM